MGECSEGLVTGNGLVVFSTDKPPSISKGTYDLPITVYDLGDQLAAVPSVKLDRYSLRLKQPLWFSVATKAFWRKCNPKVVNL